MQLSNIITKPIITERSFELASGNRYLFKVSMSASKGSIAAEVKKLFGVDVLEVNTTIMPGKPKRIVGTRRFTKTSKWKKAVVHIKEGQKIDLFPKE